MPGVQYLLKGNCLREKGCFLMFKKTQNETERTVRFKMYKDGKKWVTRGLAIMGVTLIVGAPVMTTGVQLATIEMAHAEEAFQFNSVPQSVLDAAKDNAVVDLSNNQEFSDWLASVVRNWNNYAYQQAAFKALGELGAVLAANANLATVNLSGAFVAANALNSSNGAELFWRMNLSSISTSTFENLDISNNNFDSNLIYTMWISQGKINETVKNMNLTGNDPEMISKIQTNGQSNSANETGYGVGGIFVNATNTDGSDNGENETPSNPVEPETPSVTPSEPGDNGNGEETNPSDPETPSVTPSEPGDNGNGEETNPSEPETPSVTPSEPGDNGNGETETPSNPTTPAEPESPTVPGDNGNGEETNPSEPATPSEPGDNGNGENETPSNPTTPVDPETPTVLETTVIMEITTAKQHQKYLQHQVMEIRETLVTMRQMVTTTLTKEMMVLRPITALLTKETLVS